MINSFGTDRINTSICIIFVPWCCECFREDWFTKLKYLQTLYHSVRSNAGSPEVGAVSWYTLAIHEPELNTRPWFGTLCVESAELDPLRRVTLKPWRRRAAHLPATSGIWALWGSQRAGPSTFVPLLLKLGHPEKKIAGVTETEDQRKVSVTQQSNEERSWLKGRKHGYAPCYKNLSDDVFLPEMQKQS